MPAYNGQGNKTFKNEINKIALYDCRQLTAFVQAEKLG